MPRKGIESPFQEKKHHDVVFGLKVAETNPVTREILAATCQFCSYFGPEETYVANESGDLVPKAKRGRKSSGYFTKPFRTDQYRRHMLSMHPARWQQYEQLSLSQKERYFDELVPMHEDPSPHEPTPSSKPRYSHNNDNNSMMNINLNNALLMSGNGNEHAHPSDILSAHLPLPSLSNSNHSEHGLDKIATMSEHEQKSYEAIFEKLFKEVSKVDFDQTLFNLVDAGVVGDKLKVFIRNQYHCDIPEKELGIYAQNLYRNRKLSKRREELKRKVQEVLDGAMEKELTSATFLRWESLMDAILERRKSILSEKPAIDFTSTPERTLSPRMPLLPVTNHSKSNPVRALMNDSERDAEQDIQVRTAIIPPSSEQQVDL